jgi:DUF2945 family protein
MGALTGHDLRTGDLVSWIGSGGIVNGRVIRHLTRPERVGGVGALGTRVRASEEHPYVVVESELGGGQVAQRPEQLTRL